MVAGSLHHLALQAGSFVCSRQYWYSVSDLTVRGMEVKQYAYWGQIYDRQNSLSQTIVWILVL
jgi:hypothetical protein